MMDARHLNLVIVEVDFIKVHYEIVTRKTDYYYNGKYWMKYFTKVTA